MNNQIEIRTGVFVDADTATPLQHRAAAVLGMQRVRNRAHISGKGRGPSDPTPAAPLIDGTPIPEHVDEVAQQFFGKDAADLTRPQLLVLMEFYERQAGRHQAMADAYEAERHERFGADIVQFPGGGA